MMKANDEKINQYYSLHPQKFRVLETMTMMQSKQIEGDGTIFELDLEICLRTEEKPHPSLTLRFAGIRNFRLKQPSWSVFNLPFIEITSIRDRQWENLNYSVKETEDETLSFQCRDFEWEVAE